MCERVNDALEALNYFQTSGQVRYGHWIENSDRDGWICSECHKNDYYAYVYNYYTDVKEIQDYYCPFCGVKMDGGEDK